MKYVIVNLKLNHLQEYIVINVVENQLEVITIQKLEFHHENPNEKEFKLGSGNTISWKEYKQEALKCILVCSNCHKEIHSKLGYIYN